MHGYQRMWVHDFRAFDALYWAPGAQIGIAAGRPSSTTKAQNAL